ncbi:MAG: hypothetical protein WD060_00165 [Pirellulales bacterium]
MLLEIDHLAAHRAALVGEPVHGRGGDLRGTDEPAGGTELPRQM